MTHPEQKTKPEGELPSYPSGRLDPRVAIAAAEVHGDQ
jgi:hypothetical protein